MGRRQEVVMHVNLALGLSLGARRERAERAGAESGKPAGQDVASAKLRAVGAERRLTAAAIGKKLAARAAKRRFDHDLLPRWRAWAARLVVRF
jgi:hypothetical protein